MNKRIIIIAIISLIVDQVSKIFASMFLTLNASKVLIKNFFNLTLCHNYGVAFGLLGDHRVIIFLCTGVAVAIIIKFMYSFKNNKLNSVAFGLLLGGLVGNLLDRMVFGYVRDFFDFILFKYDFPVFNVADICIVVGVFLLCIAVLKGEEKDGNSSNKW